MDSLDIIVGHQVSTITIKRIRFLQEVKINNKVY